MSFWGDRRVLVALIIVGAAIAACGFVMFSLEETWALPVAIFGTSLVMTSAAELWRQRWRRKHPNRRPLFTVTELDERHPEP